MWGLCDHSQSSGFGFWTFENNQRQFGNYLTSLSNASTNPECKNPFSFDENEFCFLHLQFITINLIILENLCT
jgi:hypothetical protein